MFTEYFTSLEQRKAEEEEKRAIGILNTKEKFETQKAQSTTTASGLQYLITKKGDGEAVKTTNKAKTHYAVYFDSGKLQGFTENRLEKVIETAKVMKIRRGVDFTSIDCESLEAIFKKTASFRN